jgi:hypothetical protein
MKTYKDYLDSTKRDYLSNYYLLPLLGLNFNLYGESCFVNSYISSDCSILCAEVTDFALVAEKGLVENHHFKRRWKADGRCMYGYRIPPELEGEVRKYAQGQYTQFTEESKNTILLYSGLPWDSLQPDSRVMCDFRLLALYRHEAMVEAFEEYFGVSDNLQQLPQELLPPPPPGAFIEVDVFV